MRTVYRVQTEFLSTPSARRATRENPDKSGSLAISIHALREEGDPRLDVVVPDPADISIHALREEGDGGTTSTEWTPTNFYPRPPRGGRPRTNRVPALHQEISIHALREEGDEGAVASTTTPKIFLSTPSARRATDAGSDTRQDLQDFYPRPPRGGRPRELCLLRSQEPISIHALREEGDLRREVPEVVQRQISIHALREEGDRTIFSHGVHGLEFLSTPSARRATPTATPSTTASRYFYPRPPRGGRPRAGAHDRRNNIFLSTPSARRATLSVMV